MAVQQNDPTELLEVFTRGGEPTGFAKSRAAIHVDGDWHICFHCWILRGRGQHVLLQQRSMRKDTFPGCWDAAAAGHWRFGESAAEAAREIAEELGIEVGFEQLTYRGRERNARRMPNGLIDRELHEVYVLCDERPLLDFRPDPAEVMGLAAFRLSDVLELAAGRRARGNAIEGVRVDGDGSLSPAGFSVGQSDLVPYSAARLRRMLWRACTS